MSKTKCAIVGVTGTVGQRYISFLADHPMFEIAVVAASKASEGKTVSERCAFGSARGWHLPSKLPDHVAAMEIVNAENIKAFEKEDVRVVFSCPPSAAAGPLESAYRDAGMIVQSKASAHRKDKDVPIIIPEINPDHLDVMVKAQKEKYGGAIVTDPNCTTAGVSIALWPIYQKFGIKKVIANTWQAVSGGGFDLGALLITDNVVPYIGGEEAKLESEMLKIFGKVSDDGTVKDAEFRVASTCTRVPVTDGHFETAYVNTGTDVTPEAAIEAMAQTPNLPRDLDCPFYVDPLIEYRTEVNRPQTRLDRDAGRIPGMAVSVGRMRKGLEDDSLFFCVLSHNTVRGAAGSSVLGAELMVKKGLIG